MSGSGIAEEPSAAASTPGKETKSPQPLKKTLEVKDLIADLRKAALFEKDAATVVAILKERELITATMEKKSVTNTDFILWLENFWDYDRSPYIEEKRLHNLRIGKGTIALKWAYDNEIISNTPFKGLRSFSGAKRKRA